MTIPRKFRQKFDEIGNLAFGRAVQIVEMTGRLTILGLLFFAPGTFAEEAWQVTGKAWKSFAAKDWDAVVEHANRASRVWGAGAKKMNGSLAAYPSAHETKGYAILNEVATLLWMKGEALRMKGDKKGALAAYHALLADYKFGQCWDANGWWWKPADAARDRIRELAPGAQKEISLETEPLKPSLKLPGKKGVCFAFRPPGEEKGETWEENLPKVKALKAYWNYSWGMERIAQQPTGMEFVPMAWGAWEVEKFKHHLQATIVPQIESGLAKRALGFNEPDKDDQANMPYTEALKYWPLLEELGVPLCSPACANPLSDVDASTQGVRGTWMRDFMSEADKRGYRVDYIGVHWYGGTSPSAFQARMIEIYERYGRRPLLVTEFSPADWSAKSLADHRFSAKEVLAFMKEVLPWLEEQNWIAGYAWFSFAIDKAVGTSSALFDENGNLTACGKYYQSVTTENPAGDREIEP